MPEIRQFQTIRKDEAIVTNPPNSRSSQQFQWTEYFAGVLQRVAIVMGTAGTIFSITFPFAFYKSGIGAIESAMMGFGYFVSIGVSAMTLFVIGGIAKAVVQIARTFPKA